MQPTTTTRLQPCFAVRLANMRSMRASNTLKSPFNGRFMKNHSAMSVVTKAESGGVLISKVEIPAFIPRDDISDQLLRWALIEIQEEGVANVGCPCKVTAYNVNGSLMGFTVSFMKDGESDTEVRVAFDDDVATKHEWVGRGPDGMPMLEGKQEEVSGKNFEIRKLGENKVSDATKVSIKEFCQLLVGAINKYYAFGSCFVDDTT